MSDLNERLEKVARHKRSQGRQFGKFPIELEAVDALKAKDKRIAELEKTNAQLNHDIGEYVDETARLREKLQNALNNYGLPKINDRS